MNTKKKGGDGLLFSYLYYMNNKKPTDIEKIKYIVTYEDDECISIWKYDKNKNPNGPIEVENKWKRSYNPWNKDKKKTIGELAKEQKKRKRG